MRQPKIAKHFQKCVAQAAEGRRVIRREDRDAGQAAIDLFGRQHQARRAPHKLALREANLAADLHEQLGLGLTDESAFPRAAVNALTDSATGQRAAMRASWTDFEGR